MGMNILVTGAKGMVGTALCNNLRNIRDSKDRTRPNLVIDEIFEYDIDSTEHDLREYCSRADFVFNLAGANRPKNSQDFMGQNRDFASRLLNELMSKGNKCPVMLSSSVQATLDGRYAGSEYGQSKLAGEELFFSYGEKTGVPVYVFRFPNLMGHSRPNYNSAISTFCWAIANNEPFTVNDPKTEIELLYIDDLIQGLFDLLEGRVFRCEFDGAETVLDEDGRFCCVPHTYKVSLGSIVDNLQSFKKCLESFEMPSMPEDSFEKKLFSLYLTYLPAKSLKTSLKMNCDERGSFTELMKTTSNGQVSVNVSKPGVTKGQHWHNSKWEQFIVVKGHALIRERNINTNETVEFEVSDRIIESVCMIPGWTHSITNLSETEDLVTIMLCNETFDPTHPDTYYEEV